MAQVPIYRAEVAESENECAIYILSRAAGRKTGAVKRSGELSIQPKQTHQTKEHGGAWNPLINLDRRSRHSASTEVGYARGAMSTTRAFKIMILVMTYFPRTEHPKAGLRLKCPANLATLGVPCPRPHVRPRAPQESVSRRNAKGPAMHPILILGD